MHIKRTNTKVNTLETSNSDFELTTEIGTLSFKQNSENFPNGIMIKLNNVPIILIEEIDFAEEMKKLVVKRYPNKNIIDDENYLNLKPYNISLRDMNLNTVNSILKDIEN